MKHLFVLSLCLARVAVAADSTKAPDFHSSSLSVGFAETTPAFSWFAVDSLGNAENLDNIVLLSKLPNGKCTLKRASTNEFRYVHTNNYGHEAKIWRGTVSPKRMVLQSEFVEG